MAEKTRPGKSAGKLIRGIIFMILGVIGWLVVPAIAHAVTPESHNELVIATMAVWFVGRAIACGLVVAGFFSLLASIIE